MPVDLAKFSEAVQEQVETINRALRRLGETAAQTQRTAALHVEAFKQHTGERVTAEQHRAAAAAEACVERCREIIQDAILKVQELTPMLQRIADATFSPEQQRRFAEQLRAASESIRYIISSARSMLSAKYAEVASRAAGARALASERAVVVCSAVSERTAGARAVAAEHAEVLRGKAAEVRDAVAGKAAEMRTQVEVRAAGVRSTVADRTAGTRVAVNGAVVSARDSVAEQIKALEEIAQTLLRHAEASVSPRVKVVRDKAGAWSSPYISRAIELKTQAAQQVALWSPDTAAQLDAVYNAATAGELKEASKLPSLLYAAMRCAASAAMRREREAPADDSQSDCGATDDEAGTAQGDDEGERPAVFA